VVHDTLVLMKANTQVHFVGQLYFCIGGEIYHWFGSILC